MTAPTTAEVAANIVAQVESATAQTTPLLPKAFTRVLSKALGGVHVLLYKYAGFLGLQQYVEHATMEPVTILGKVVRPLVELGKQVGVGEPLDATRAEVLVRVTVQLQTGALPSGSQLLHPASGVLYLTTVGVALDAPTVEVTARASSDQAGGGGEGAIGNLLAGDVLSFANPLPNVGRTAVVLSQSVTGSEAESVPAYRARITRRYQQKPQGGAYADYQLWGAEEPGVLNIYPYRGAPGEVDVYVEATEASSGSPDGIPTPAQLAQVLALIEQDDAGLASRRPANAAVNVLPIRRLAFDVVATGLDAPDAIAAEAAIEDAVDEYLRSREPFIVGISPLPRVDRVTQPAVAGVIDDAVSAVGGTIATVRLEQNGSPVAAYTLGAGEKTKLGTITFS
jgi:hypothetical protein